MKILLFGKNGQVGSELQRTLLACGDVIALDRFGQVKLCGNLENLAGIQETIFAIKPDIIVNAAAYTQVDKAETEIELCELINIQAPVVMANAAAKLNTILVHFSSDYVFNGSGHKPWMEDDATEPLNHYGKTKLLGEKGIQASHCRHLIFRTSWVYGKNGHNFVKTILRLALEKEELRIIDDQIGVPTGAELLSQATANAVKLSHASKNVFGVYHLVPKGEISWYEFACFILKTAQSLGLNPKVKKITPISSSEYKTLAQRPFNSRLNTDKFAATFGLFLPSWQDEVVTVIQDYMRSI